MTEIILNPKQYELELLGKTYTLSKMTPPLRGTTTRVFSYIRREAEGLSPEELNSLEWAQGAFAGAIFEHVPDLIWAFLTAQDKTAIGTKEKFYDGLTAESITGFFHWASAELTSIQHFLPEKPELANPAESPSN